jgi:serine protease Do
LKSEFVELTRKKMAAVVQIYVEGHIGEDVKCILNPRLGDLETWSGSGFFIKCPFGKDLIVTNAHVVKNAKSIEIMSMLTSEERFEAELVGIVREEEPDIAIIKLKEGELGRLKKSAVADIPYLSLRMKNDIPRGTRLKAIGYPMGMSEPNITGGEITNFISGDRQLAEKYVTDAAINPGNSGGPAIDEEGNVIGMNTSIFQEAENIGFITPANFISIILKNIFKNNAICFADLGGNFQRNSEVVAAQLSMKKSAGIIVSSLEKGGFLEQAGVIVGDVIIGVDGDSFDRHGICLGKQYYHRRNIFDIFKLSPIGKVVELTIWRDGKKKKIKAKAAGLPKRKIASRPFIKERHFLDLWGMTIQVLSFEIVEAFHLIDNQVFYQILKNADIQKERLIVTHIQKGSSADQQEWSIGEVLYSFEGTKIRGLLHLLKLVGKSKKVAKFVSEAGTIGYFDSKSLEEMLYVHNPSEYLS